MQTSCGQLSVCEPVATCGACIYGLCGLPVYCSNPCIVQYGIMLKPIQAWGRVSVSKPDTKGCMHSAV